MAKLRILSKRASEGIPVRKVEEVKAGNRIRSRKPAPANPLTAILPEPEKIQIR